MDYHGQLVEVEMHESLAQHLKSLNMMEELMFAHNNFTTYKLEFNGIPPNVIRNLKAIRGKYGPQDWSGGFLDVVSTYQHPKIQSILFRAMGINNFTAFQ